MEEHQNPEEISASEERQTPPSNPFLIPGSIVLAGAFVAAAILYSNSKGSVPSLGAGTLPPPPAAVNTADLPDDDPILGNPDAPVTIVEFADFQCPFCGRFFRTTERQIIDTYVKSGQVRLVYRDFPFLGEESEWASQAAECADEQGKFWEYHRYLFEHQKGENQGAFAKNHLKSFAREIGLDGTTFDSCLDTEKYKAEVLKDLEDGRNAGVDGTPTSFINGKPLVGAIPFGEFDVLIKEALANVKK